jgi:hypothetical protein
LDERETRERQRTAAGWLNERLEMANQLFQRWPVSSQDVSLRMGANEWEKATYEGLAEHFPTQQAHFRLEVGFEREMGRQNLGMGSWESVERTMLRRRLRRLSEIAERASEDRL